MKKLSRKDKKNIAIAIIAIVFVLVNERWQIFENLDQESSSKKQSNQNITKTKETRFIYTKHAKCRMECRNIDPDHIQKVFNSGRINYKKSKPQDTPCPTQAREAKASDGRDLRVVYALCPSKTKVITAIDLDNEYNCTCY